MREIGCVACPRQCRALRSAEKGFCGVGEDIKIARIGLHLWEEPCISFGNGSGTIFFSGCNLRCVFCQNQMISQGGKGREISRETLIEEMLNLQERGAGNINLVTPSHYTEAIASVLQDVKHKLSIPVIYNSSGYDKAESLQKLDGLIDIYLPDVKYFSPELSQKYSGARDYFSVAEKAIKEMFRQCGYYQEDEMGHMRKGVLLRHMVLPSCYRDSVKVLDWVAENYAADRMAISLMSQYFPTYRATEYPELNRRLTTFEYKKVVEHARNLGFVNGFVQKRESASSSYVPDFDY
ncbi:MAG: radical SAM protein [Clostridia bacterium]|nr:radical SAM protein [Clostridia bacterium]